MDALIPTPHKDGKRLLREVDGRLRFLDRQLAHAEVVDPGAQTRRDRVFLGATITYLTERDEEVSATIAGLDEASKAEGKISVGSPVALALPGSRVGDEERIQDHGGDHAGLAPVSGPGAMRPFGPVVLPPSARPGGHS